MLDSLARILPFLLIAVLVVNLLQRGLTKTRPDQDAALPGPGDARRVATLLLAGVVLGTWVAVLFLLRRRSPDWTAAPLLAVVAAVAFGLRGRLRVFPLRCEWCGKRLPPGVTLGFDATATARYEAGACPAADCAPVSGSDSPTP